MRILLVLLIFIYGMFTSFAHASCGMILKDEDAQKLIDEAYFIGLAKGAYLDKFPSGAFREVRLKPFAVYSSSSSTNLRDMIIISGDDVLSSCDARILHPEELGEVMVVWENKQLKIRRMNFMSPDFKEKLRKKMRYVGEE